MTSPATTKSLSLPSITTLRNLLDLLASLRDLSDPFGSPSQLQIALQMLSNLATTLGLDSNWFAWLQAIQNNPQLLSLVLAVGQYLESMIEPTPTPTPASARRQPVDTTATALAIDWNAWLSLVEEIAQLLQQLWPAQ
jgi:hypothetical protein